MTGYDSTAGTIYTLNGTWTGRTDGKSICTDCIFKGSCLRQTSGTVEPQSCDRYQAHKEQAT